MVSEIQKPDSVETLLGPPVRRERSVAARRAARLERGEREARIVSLLNRGVAVAEIAAREGLSLKRMRNLVREILAQRMPQRPAEFLALQVGRLNEALLVSYSAMHTSVAGANFEAVDRVVKIVRELDPITDLALSRGRARNLRRAGFRRPSSARSRSKLQLRGTRKWRRKLLKRLNSDSRMAPLWKRGERVCANALKQADPRRAIRGAGSCQQSCVAATRGTRLCAASCNPSDAAGSRR
jgi:hypothetical protein